MGKICCLPFPRQTEELANKQKKWGGIDLRPIIILMKYLYLPLLLLFAACAFVACGDDADDDFWGAGGQGNTQPVLPATGAEKHRLEVPAMELGNDFIAHYDGDVMTYCLEYDRSKWHSRWIAFRFDNKTRAKNVSRKDYGIRPQYPADPKLPTGVAIPSDASFNGYDHGHLCASADRLYSRTANDQTFYMTNMSPMISNFNGGYWATLEGLVQSLGRNVNFSDTLYVVKGGTIQDGMFSQRVASGRIVVPKYYFMALLRYRGGTYSAIAFWMEHKDYGNNFNNQANFATMKQHTVSVDQLESLTGIDFFHNLPDAVEVLVEKQCTPSEWGM